MTDVFKSAASAVLDAMVNAHGPGLSVTYYSTSGAQTVSAYVYEQQALFGPEFSVSEPRFLAVISREQVDEPRRGDRIIDHDGVEWKLEERIDANEGDTTWAVQRR